MKVTLLGCGTSSGVPRIDGKWGAADPANPKNRRRRVSILVQEENTSLVVDTSPDLREQCLSNNIKKIDAVLYTHDHADHTHGIDDLRGFRHAQGKLIDIYGLPETLDVLQRRFDYIFVEKLGYPPICKAHEISGDEPFRLGDILVRPFRQVHGPIVSLGYRFGKVAYSTDVSDLPEAAFEALQGIDTWIVDALRYEPHPTHSHLEKTLGWIERVKPRRAILTHMTGDMDYDTLRAKLPKGVEPGHDGLTLEL
jgi:phosphoribosyl 1,2-cyclic phosphate phosphodiesterase